MSELVHDKNFTDKDVVTFDFGILKEEEIIELKKNTREIIYNKGETIFKQNTFVSDVIFIKDGIVKLMTEGLDRKNYIISIYVDNQYIGLSQLFGENKRSYTVAVLKKATIYTIEKIFLKNLILNSKPLRENIFTLCAQEHNFLFHRLNILGTKNMHGRLSDTLLYLSDSLFSEINIYSYISRRELADLSAMSIESTIRLLNEFKNDKLINITGKKIEINKPELLKILCKVG